MPRTKKRRQINVDDIYFYSKYTRGKNINCLPIYFFLVPLLFQLFAIKCVKRAFKLTATMSHTTQLVKNVQFLVDKNGQFICCPFLFVHHHNKVKSHRNRNDFSVSAFCFCISFGCNHQLFNRPTKKINRLPLSVDLVPTLKHITFHL